MSKTLFKKSKKSSEHDDIWDDSLLIKAYEESVKLHKEEVAKQLAMKTNTCTTAEIEDNESSEQTESSEAVEFKVGDFARSTFSEDGIDYEAEILSVNENGTCLIRYIGYGNEERVKMEDLVLSWGPEAREEQKILAEADKTGAETEQEHKEGFHQFVLKKTSNLQSSLPPMPPMPPAMFDDSRDSECMAAMLMSWYMSGYYTGLYHGRKQAKEEIQPKANIEQPSTSSKAQITLKKKKIKRNSDV